MENSIRRGCFTTDYQQILLFHVAADIFVFSGTARWHIVRVTVKLQGREILSSLLLIMAFSFSA